MEAKSGGMRKTKAKKKNQTKDKRVQSMGPEWNAETHQRQKKEDRFDENFRCVRWPPMARPVGFVSVFLFYRDSFVFCFFFFFSWSSPERWLRPWAAGSSPAFRRVSIWSNRTIRCPGAAAAGPSLGRSLPLKTKKRKENHISFPIPNSHSRRVLFLFF